MKSFWPILALALCTVIDVMAQAPVNTNRASNRPQRDPKMDAFYKIGPDSMKQEGVPEGRFD